MQFEREIQTNSMALNPFLRLASKIHKLKFAFHQHRVRDGARRTSGSRRAAPTSRSSTCFVRMRRACRHAVQRYPDIMSWWSLQLVADGLS